MFDYAKPAATDDCNCLWSYCEHHKGSMCKGTAYGYRCDSDDDGCGEIHWIGDLSFGDGIHICPECGNTIIQFLIYEIGEFMNKVELGLPRDIKELTEVIRSYYCNKRLNPTGWQTPVTDALAVMQFVNLCANRNFVSAELTKEGIRITKKVLSLRTDMQAASLKKEVIKGLN